MDLRDYSIRDALPYGKPTILSVGCGKARLEHELVKDGYNVCGCDVEEQVCNFPFKIMDILKPDGMKYDVVICSEVIEHIKNYQEALKNLVYIANERVIITTPYRDSYWDPSHVNFWNDETIEEFRIKPYSTSISKIRSKKEDVQSYQQGYLIIIDKKQHYEG